MGEAARLRADERFTVGAMATAMERLYSRVTGIPAPAPA
jgi:hypothetical protein